MKKKLSFAKHTLEEHSRLINMTGMDRSVKKILIADCSKLKATIESMGEPIALHNNGRVRTVKA